MSEGDTQTEARRLLDELSHELLAAILAQEQDNLLAMIQYGSTTSGPLKHETDLDLMLVFRTLPADRFARFEVFYPVEQRMAGKLASLRQLGFSLELSPVLKTEAEFRHFSLLYLDMVDRSRIHHDPTGLGAAVLERTRQWIAQTGAYRVQRGLRWYWVLRPEYRHGEEFEIGFSS